MRWLAQPLQPPPFCLDILKRMRRGISEGALKISQTQCNREMERGGRRVRERESVYVGGVAVSADKSAYGN